MITVDARTILKLKQLMDSISTWESFNEQLGGPTSDASEACENGVAYAYEALDTFLDGNIWNNEKWQRRNHRN